MFVVLSSKIAFFVISLLRGISSKGRIVTYRFPAGLFAPDFSPALI